MKEIVGFIISICVGMIFNVQSSYSQREKYNVLIITGNSKFEDEKKTLQEFYSDVEVQLEWESPNFKLVTAKCLDWAEAEELRRRLSTKFPKARVAKCTE